MLYFSLAALLLVMTLLQRLWLAKQPKWQLGSILPLGWTVLNVAILWFVPANNQPLLLLACLGLALLLSCWAVARVNRQENFDQFLHVSGKKH